MTDKMTEEAFVTEGLEPDEIEALNAMEQGEDFQTPEGGEENQEPVQTPEAEQAANQEGAPEGGEAGQEQQSPQMVDVRAVQEARAEARQLRENMARLEERTNILLQQHQQEQQQREEPQDQMPSDDDPMGQLAWLKKNFMDMKQAQTDQQEAQRQAQEQHQQDVQLISQADSVLAQATAAHDDIQDAFDFGMNALRDAVAKQGYVGQQAQQVIDEQLKLYARGAPSDPNQMAEYVRANARYWGWTGKQNPEPQPNVQQQLEQTQQRQERHQSLSNAGGGEAPAALDAKQLAEMSDAEFNKLMSNPAKAAEIEKIMGAG